jgi:predicted PurR-regulated permease PerM
MQGSIAASFRMAAIWAAVAAALFLLWWLRSALLLAFGGILLSILLRALAHLICRVTRLPYGGGLFLATIIVALAVFFCFWTFGASLTSQFRELLSRIESGAHQLSSWLEREGVPKSTVSNAWRLLGGAAQLPLSSLIQFAEVAVILAISAIYLAANPDLYRRGFIALFAPRLRSKVSEALDLIGSSLKLWMLGQLSLMAIVGITSYVAVLAIGLPNPLALGLVAGITEAVPYLGPFLGAVPAILVALTQGLLPAIFTAGAYLGIHLIEGYAVGPLLQRWFVHIPPVLILLSIFVSQLIFGVPGFLLAAPLAVAAFAAVKVLYVQDTLHEKAEFPKTVEI